MAVPTFSAIGQLEVRLYEELIRHPNLIFLVPMNEASGAVLDRCVRNRLSGTVSGSPTRGVALANGFVGMTFVGATPDYVDFGNISALNFERTDPFSLLAILKPNTVATQQDRIVGKANSAPYGWAWINEQGQSVDIYLQATDGQIIRKRSGTALTNGTVYILGLTYDGSSTAAGVNHYKNGVLDNGAVLNDTLTSTTIQTTSPVRIGADANGTTALDGTVGFVAAFNAELTAREMKLFAHLGGFL